MQSFGDIGNLELEEICWSYEKIGGTLPPLLLFHGFGQDRYAFRSWFSILTQHYTIYTIDVYYHQESNRPLCEITLAEWKYALQAFLHQESIDSFSLGAFSLGGRFALASMILFPTKIEKLYLVAPDGIYKSLWYQLSTSPIINKFFKYLMYHPKVFFGLLDTLEYLKLVQPVLIKFARYELQSETNRKSVYKCWTYLKPFLFSGSEINQIIARHNIPTHLFLGEKDRIIPIKEIYPYFIENSKVSFFPLPLRHHQLIDGAIEYLP
jgi:pimeloyl-ACP methyl ester carboxylesterase